MIDIKTDLKNNIVLNIDEEFYLQCLSRIDLIEKNKANFEVLIKVESIVKKWIKIIEKVFTNKSYFMTKKNLDTNLLKSLKF